jgi:hypothetical protein
LELVAPYARYSSNGSRVAFIGPEGNEIGVIGRDGVGRRTISLEAVN